MVCWVCVCSSTQSVQRRYVSVCVRVCARLTRHTTKHTQKIACAWHLSTSRIVRAQTRESPAPEQYETLYLYYIPFRRRQRFTRRAPLAWRVTHFTTRTHIGEHRMVGFCSRRAPTRCATFAGATTWCAYIDRDPRDYIVCVCVCS